MSIQYNDSNNAEKPVVAAAEVDELVKDNKKCEIKPGAHICPAYFPEFTQCNVPVFRAQCSELSLRDASIRVRGELLQLREIAGYGDGGTFLGVQIRIEVNVNCNDNPFVLELPEDRNYLNLHINGNIIRLTYIKSQGPNPLNKKIGNNVLVLNYLEIAYALRNYLNNMQECDDKFDITFDSVVIGQVLACAKLNSSCEILCAKLSFVNAGKSSSGVVVVGQIPLVLQQ
jgi:hypothetical protein